MIHLNIFRKKVGEIMKRVIELLKEAGTVGRIQKHFNDIKPPFGTSDETIIKAIKGCVVAELSLNKELEHKFFDAIMLDVAEALKDEMHIEYVSKTETVASAADMLCRILGINIVVDTRKE